MSVTPANRSIAHQPDVPGKNPVAHNLDNNVYAAQAPKADPGATVTPATPSPQPPAAAQHDIFDQRMHEKHDLEREKNDKAREKVASQEEHERKDGKDPSHDRADQARAEVPSAEETLNFALIDIERGLAQLRQSSASTIAGTWAHTAILYFEAAVSRIDWSLDRARGGRKITTEQRAVARADYEKRYRDVVPPQVLHPAPMLDKAGPGARVE
jgi:hypothetical protein